MYSSRSPENCIDVIRPFRDQLAAHHLLDDVQFIGGIGAAALVHESSVILPDEKRIVAPADLYLPVRRHDGNLRDMDVLVLSPNEAHVDRVEHMAEKKIDGQLEVSAFGFHTEFHTEQQMLQPYGWKSLKTFVSDRYVAHDGHVDKALFPFSVPINPKSLDSWSLEVGDTEFPVAGPATSVLNYLNRSISGLRAKDVEKVQAMATNVFTKAPELIDWIVDGPGRSELELGRLLHSLQGPANYAQAETLTIAGAVELKPLPIRSLMEHQAFMMHHADSKTQENILAWARLKSMVLRKAESYEQVVSLYQKYAERIFDGINKNK